MKFSIFFSLAIFFSFTAEAVPNYHLVGWVNTFVPGSGEALLGDYQLAGIQAASEIGTFAWGFSLSKRSPMTLDGVPEELPKYRKSKRFTLESLDKPIYANILQEFGIKFHMVNVYDAYRSAAKEQGITEGIDQSSTKDLFLAPFDSKNLSDPWVWIPLGIVSGFTITDYYTTRNSVGRGQSLTPYSNFLFAVHYGVWEALGSGAPEEMFYRGFVQNEMNSIIPSPFFTIPMSSVAFAFSHGPGDGRISSAIAGMYLGYLAHRNNGNLGPGIALHFWLAVALGLESILLSQESQHATPPGGFSVQINF